MEEAKKPKPIEKRQYRIRFTEPMLGTVAMDPKVYESYIESKKERRKEGGPAADDEAATVEKLEEKGWTGFHRVDPKDPDSPLFVYDYFVKGFLKGAGNVLKDVLQPPVKQLKSKLDDFVFVFPRRVLLGKTKPDGVLERPLRAMTMQGPRVTLARSDYVDAGTEITFTIWLLPHSALTWELIDTLMAHGQLMGMGQFRNGSYGRFKVVEVTPVP